MKKLLIFISPFILFLSCKKGDNLPRTETIIAGSKWGLTIGSSPVDVYRQLQTLGKEKGFSQVAVVYRQPYSKPQDIEHLLAFYDALTLDRNSGVVDRALIQFPGDTITWISAGGGLPEEVAKWPREAPDETAIHKNDLVDALYRKLLAIYQLPAYSNYQIVLPDKPLGKPYDPDMANYEEWAFTMTVKVRPGIAGISSVRLYFQDSKLIRIRHDYNEQPVYD